MHSKGIRYDMIEEFNEERVKNISEDYFALQQSCMKESSLRVQTLAS